MANDDHKWECVTFLLLHFSNVVAEDEINPNLIAEITRNQTIISNTLSVLREKMGDEFKNAYRDSILQKMQIQPAISSQTNSQRT